MTPEALIKKKIREWLKERGAYVFSPVQTGFGVSTLDILVCLNGRFIGIEAKVPGKHPTARQEIVMAEIEKAGGIAMCVTSVEELQRRLFTRL